MRHLGLAACVLLLASCAMQPKRRVDPAALEAAWSTRQQQLGEVQSFDLAGRIAVKGGGLSGALRWQQRGEHLDLRIAGPFGAGALSIVGLPTELAIRGKDIDLVTTTPQQVLAERTGWRLPLDALRWWVLGLPSPQSAAEVLLDASGRAERITQSGWTLGYADYRSNGVLTLPGRIQATQGEWSATLIVEQLATVQ